MQVSQLSEKAATSFAPAAPQGLAQLQTQITATQLTSKSQSIEPTLANKNALNKKEMDIEIKMKSNIFQNKIF